MEPSKTKKFDKSEGKNKSIIGGDFKYSTFRNANQKKKRISVNFTLVQHV